MAVLPGTKQEKSNTKPPLLPSLLVGVEVEVGGVSLAAVEIVHWIHFSYCIWRWTHACAHTHAHTHTCRKELTNNDEFPYPVWLYFGYIDGRGTHGHIMGLGKALTKVTAV